MADLKARRHLFFDLDDTLWDFEANSSAVLHELFHEFSMQQKLGVDVEGFYSAYKATNRQLWKQYYKREIDKAWLRSQRFNLVFNAFGYDHYEESLAMSGQYLERAPRGRLLKEGCLEVLDYLQGRYSLHLITNGFKETQAVKIDNCGLRSYFSAVVISDEHALLKPEAAIFRMAETMAGAVAGECLMIGDNLDCDVKGALDAGWEAIYFSEQPGHDFEGHSIATLRDLKELL